MRLEIRKANPVASQGIKLLLYRRIHFSERLVGCESDISVT